MDPNELVTLAELVPLAIEASNKVIAEEIAREERNLCSVSCSKGCSACCRYLVQISIPEAIYLRDRFAELEPSRREEHERRIVEVVERLKQDTLFQPVCENLIRNPEDQIFEYTLYDLSKRYLALGISCPFLEDESCSIYPIRPLVCRHYLVTSPPQFCVDPYLQNVRRIGMRARTTDILAGIAAELLRQPVTTIALPLFTEWLSAHSNVAGRQWPRAQLHEKFHAVIKDR